MKKKLLLFIPFFSLLIAGCNGGGNTDSSSTTNSTNTSQPSGTSATSGGSSRTSSGSGSNSGSSSTTSAPIAAEYTVRFLVDGVVIKESKVKHGEKAVAPANPTKDPDAEAIKYVFACWDRDLDIPIIRDVDFNATFDAYASELLVDDFESYAVDNELADNGWFAIGYSNTNQWTKETSAALSLSHNAADGEQALRFDCYKNSTPFMIRKEYEDNPYNKCANAIRFKMMTPMGANINRVLITIPLSVVPVPGATSDPVVKHEIPYTTADYFECIIPFAADGWKLWDNPINLKEDTAAYDFNCDRLPTMMSKIEFCLRYPSHSPSDYLAFLDSVSFVTIDESITDVVMNEYIELADRYTGLSSTGNTVRVDILDKSTGDATLTVIDERTPTVVGGTVTVDGNGFTFASGVDGKLTYVGHLTNGGQKINYVSSSGELNALVFEMGMDSVQVVDNFDQYTEDGILYAVGEDNTEDKRRGCRGAYYAEYYKGTGATAPWGKGGWSLMEGDKDQLKMLSDGGHSGNNYLALKKSGAGSTLRFMQWDLFKGTTDSNKFRGKTFSFWAKASVADAVNHFKISFYSKNPTISTIDQYVKILDCYDTISATEWTHYTVNLDPEQVYYGYMVTVYGNDAATSRLYIDDVEVYNANPYSTCVTGMSLVKESTSLVVGFQEELEATFEPIDAGIRTINWVSSDETVATVSSKGVVTATGVGTATITATTVDGGFTDTCEITVTAAGNYPEGTYKGTVVVDEESYNFVISVGRVISSSISVVAANLNNVDAKASAMTFNTTTKEFSITTHGSFENKAFGTITGKYDQATNKLTNIGFAGELNTIVESNGSIVATKLTTLECDATNNAELQAIFRRRYKYNYGNWQVDNTNSDRVSRYASKRVTGTSSVKLRPYEGLGNAVGISLINEYKTAKKVSSIQFWVYNPNADKNIDLKIWIYKGSSYTTAIEVTSDTKKATAYNRNDSNHYFGNNFNYVCIGFDSIDALNWQIADMNGTDVPLAFDNIVLF